MRFKKLGLATTVAMAALCLGEVGVAHARVSVTARPTQVSAGQTVMSRADFDGDRV
jgi:hypothetical protein